MGNSNECKRDYEFGGGKQKRVLQGDNNDIFGHLGPLLEMLYHQNQLCEREINYYFFSEQEMVLPQR